MKRSAQTLTTLELIPYHFDERYIMNHDTKFCIFMLILLSIIIGGIHLAVKSKREHKRMQTETMCRTAIECTEIIWGKKGTQ